jgi:lipoprotein-releasing system permease protein
MALPYEVHLARRDLARHPWHTAGMVLGLAVAVLVMVYIPSTMSSFYDDMIDRIVEQNSPHVTVWPHEKQPGLVRRALRREFGRNVPIDLADRTDPRNHNLNGYHALARRIEASPGIAAVACFVKGNATISRGRTDLGIELEGIVPERYARVVNIAEHFAAGAVPKLGPSDVALGFRAAEKLGVHAGEHVTVATAQTQMLMRVRAIFRSGYYDKDLHHVYASLPTAQRMFRMGNEVSGVAARCGDVAHTVPVSRTLALRTGRRIRNWRDDNASLLAEIATVQRVTTFINVLVALVASAGMANVFSIFISSRQKELAILRAVGASRLSLRTILMIEALFIWLVGAIIGFTIALGVMAYEQAHPYQVSEETYGIGSYATQPKAEAFILAGALAAATMVGSAWWSGRKAAKLNPIEVIFGK